MVSQVESWCPIPFQRAEMFVEMAAILFLKVRILNFKIDFQKNDVLDIYSSCELALQPRHERSLMPHRVKIT